MKSTIHGSVTTATVDTTGLALDATLVTTNTEIGGLTETAPASDTASSGLNGRLQRIAQRLTSLIALLPTSLGQKTMANGLAVTIASDQSAVPASQSGTWNITNVSGTVSLPTGASTAAKQPALGVAGTASADVLTVQGIASMTALKVDGSGVTQPISGTVTANAGSGTMAVSLATLPALTAGSAVIGHVIVDTAPTTAVSQSGTWTVQPGNTANTTAWLVGEVTSATATTSSVASSASNVNLLALNTSRKNATFYNDSTQIAYLKLGTTASNSSYTVQMPANAYYELPVGKIYTGNIDAIWASANGNMRITELT